MPVSWGHESWGIVATIDPQTLGGSQLLSDEIDMSKWHELLMILLTGDCAANGTIDGGFASAAASGGSYSNVSGKQLTQRASHASNNDNLQFIVSLRADETS